MDRISRTEAWDLLSPQTEGFVPAALDDGLWFVSAARRLLGVILRDGDDRRFVLFQRDESGYYLRVATGRGYTTLTGAERSLANRAAQIARNMA